MVVGWGQWGPFSYISPGIQIGYNSNKGIFYGIQTSIGFKPHIIYENSLPIIIYPSICFGLKRYHHKKYNEKYIDLQSTFIKSKYTVKDYFLNVFMQNWKIFNIIKFPIGIGIGKNFSNNSSNLRLKGYMWYYASFSIDFELNEKLINLSIIPTIPIFPFTLSELSR